MKTAYSSFPYLHICTSAHLHISFATFAKRPVTGDSNLHKLRCIRARNVKKNELDFCFHPLQTQVGKAYILKDNTLRKCKKIYPKIHKAI